MSRDTVLRDEANVSYSYDNLKTQGYLEGHAQGLDRAAGYLREKAGEFFQRGDDGKATLLRGLADELVAKVRPDLVRAAKEHEENHPVVLDAE